MKKLSIFFFAFFCILVANSQRLEHHELKIPGEYNAENTTSVYYVGTSYIDGFVKIQILANNVIREISQDDLKNITFKPQNTKEFWQVKALQNEVYFNLAKNGFQYDLRKEAENDAIDYIGFLRKNNLIFNDFFIESYLYQLIYKIYPLQINDGRPGILNITIEKNAMPNAFVFPNGTLIVTTGLISCLNSEEELIAVLAHEVAHFVLDHSIININKAKARQRRAEFWSGVATTLAAGVDIYYASKNEYYSFGNFTYSVSVLSNTISELMLDRLGLMFSREQELLADKCAVDLLNFIGIKSGTLASALDKIKNVYIVNGEYSALSSNGTHPSINDRIKAIGSPVKCESKNYDVIVSSVNQYNAFELYQKKLWDNSYLLCQRNINSGVATEDDYILSALINLNKYDSEDENLKTLKYIEKAKQVKVIPNINISKYEAVALMRLNRKQQAISSLEQYILDISVEKEKQEKFNNQSILSYLVSEKEWALKLIFKIKNTISQNVTD